MHKGIPAFFHKERLKRYLFHLTLTNDHNDIGVDSGAQRGEKIRSR